MTAELDTARAYVAAGLSVIPVRADGSKAPAEPGWRAYSGARPDDATLARWFGNGHAGHYGIGIPGGAASGNLAVLDFETDAAFVTWLKSLPKDAEQRTRACPLVRTPGGGAHLYARLPEPVAGVVLARHVPDPTDIDDRTGLPRVRTKIEIRGSGAQVVAPGSPARCHKTNRPYEWLRRSWVDGGTYSEVPWETWHEWLERAAALNEVERPAVEPKIAPPKPRGAGSGTSPGDDFNHRGSWDEAGLFEAGWQWHTQFEAERGYLTRPGKRVKDGSSGTVGMVQASDGGHPLFFPFSSSVAAPLVPLKGYSRFRLFALLKHGGDFTAAARALAERGYGDQSRRAAGGTVTFRGGMGGVSPPAEVVGAENPNPPTAGPAGAKPPLPLVYFHEIGPALDAADFVEGLLIDGAMSVVYGESGCGKTFFALDLALHVASGREWRGREVEPRGVLYLALEGSHGIRNRVAAYKLDTKMNAGELPFAVVPVAVDLLDPAGDTLRVIEAARTAAATLGVPVGLIVVDTLSRAIAGGNENASEDMGAVVRHVDLIRQALPAHVCVIHHSGKDTARGARGHSLLRAATDTEIEVSRDHGAKVSRARVTKQRELDLGDEFVFSLLSVELGLNRRGKPVTSCVVRAVDAESLPTPEVRELSREMERDRKKREREALADAEADKAVLLVIDAERAKGIPAASERWIKAKAGVSKARVDDALARLLEAGTIVKSGPFKRPGGNNAMIPVPDGFQRVLESGSESF